MTRRHYSPVPFDLDATRARWMQRPGFAEAYEALTDEYAALGELLRARKLAGMTQADIAERMGVTQASVARLESSAGSRKHAPSVATLRRYADAVGCDLHISLAARTRAGAANPARLAKRKPIRPAKKRKATTKRGAKRAMNAMRGTAAKRGSAMKRTASNRTMKAMRGATAKRGSAAKRTAPKRTAKRGARA